VATGKADFQFAVLRGILLKTRRFEMRCPVAAACLCLTIVPALALDLPPRSPGQWELRVKQETPPDPEEVTTRICLDAASDRKFMELGLSIAKESCPVYETKREGDTWVIDATCTFGKMKSTSRTVVSGDFARAYTMRITATTEGAPGQPKGPQTSVTVQTGRLMQPTCLPGFRPGDMELPGGMKMNINDMGRPPGKKP
jgi:hypothetical protein